MHLFPTDTSEPKAPRSWLFEAVVVLGVLGFGYFAVMLETLPNPTAAIERVLR